MIHDPRLPLAAGTTLIGLLVWMLYRHAAMPGEVAEPHAGIPGIASLDGCVRCHSEGGLTEGCLGCHEEIGAQLAGPDGYHGYLGREGPLECAGCHVEHHGRESALVSRRSWGTQPRRSFTHPQVEFELAGAHHQLTCEECHAAEWVESFSLPQFAGQNRRQTFLGLTQDCLLCHEDPHAGGFARSCETCHDQDAFASNSRFDHGEKFPLTGGHEEPSCSKCHLLPEPDATTQPHPFPFDRVWGKACEDCHSTPHRVDFEQGCEECHPVADPLWTDATAAMTPARHAQTGFPLGVPHDHVACEKCHAPGTFEERHPDPTAPGYLRSPRTCRGCHDDVHRGQFGERSSQCLQCHDEKFFRPTTYSHKTHARLFPLTGAHEAKACTECHTPDPATQIRRFHGTPSACRDCHQDPHGGQFSEQILEGDCKACHDEQAVTFLLRPYDHAGKTGFELSGVHATIDCRGCHVEVEMSRGGTTVTAHRFVDTPRLCVSCHQDVHHGQFEDYGRCSSCHVSSSKWQEIAFDHDEQSEFPLIGAHRKVACSKCHLPVLEDGIAVVQYKPLGQECKDCHETVPRSTGR